MDHTQPRVVGYFRWATTQMEDTTNHKGKKHTSKKYPNNRRDDIQSIGGKKQNDK